MSQQLKQASTAVAPSAFDLDISIVQDNEVFSALMRSTDDNCTSTCPACASGGGGNGGGDDELSI